MGEKVGGLLSFVRSFVRFFLSVVKTVTLQTSPHGSPLTILGEILGERGRRRDGMKSRRNSPRLRIVVDVLLGPTDFIQCPLQASRWTADRSRVQDPASAHSARNSRKSSTRTPHVLIAVFVHTCPTVTTQERARKKEKGLSVLSRPCHSSRGRV